MPEHIQITGGSWMARPRHCGHHAVIAAIASLAGSAIAYADDVPGIVTVIWGASAYISAHEIAALAPVLGVLCFAVVTAILLVRTRRELAKTQTAARDAIAAANAESDHANALLRAEPHIRIAWATTSDNPEIIGDPTLVTSPDAPDRVLEFASWVDPERAQAMEISVAALRHQGAPFSLSLQTLWGRLVEAEGTVVAGRAILRLKEVSGMKRELADLQVRFQKSVVENEALRTLVEPLPYRIWVRDESDKLVFANASYAGPLEVKDSFEAVPRG